LEQISFIDTLVLNGKGGYVTGPLASANLCIGDVFILDGPYVDFFGYEIETGGLYFSNAS
jgi:hypothetical protein